MCNHHSALSLSIANSRAIVRRRRAGRPSLSIPPPPLTAYQRNTYFIIISVWQFSTHRRPPPENRVVLRDQWTTVYTNDKQQYLRTRLAARITVHFAQRRPSRTFAVPSRLDRRSPPPPPDQSTAPTGKMSGKVLLTDDVAFKALREHYASAGSSLNMKELFADDSERFDKFRYVVVTAGSGRHPQQVGRNSVQREIGRR